MKPDKYPYIICHMMTSLDGKIASGEGTDILTDYFELYMQTEANHNANAWMCGRITMEMFASKEKEELPLEYGDIEYTHFFTAPKSKYFLFGVDTKGVLRWNKSTVNFENLKDELNLVIVVTKSTPKSYLAYLKAKEISYIVSGDKEIDFDILFTILKDHFKIDKLLLEGGGVLNGSVLAAGYIDEISLLLTPIVVNKSKAPALFERKVEEALNITKFNLIEVQKLEKNCLLLKYTR